MSQQARRLCDHAGLLPGAVVAVRVHRVGPAGWASNGGGAARRGTASRRRQGAGGYSGPPRHDADRSEAGQITLYPHGEEALLRRPNHEATVWPNPSRRGQEAAPQRLTQKAANEIALLRDRHARPWHPRLCSIKQERRGGPGRSPAMTKKRIVFKLLGKARKSRLHFRSGSQDEEVFPCSSAFAIARKSCHAMRL